MGGPVQPMRFLLLHRVSGCRPLAVAGGLEVVATDELHRQLVAGAAGALDRHLEPVAGQVNQRQIGERVVADRRAIELVALLFDLLGQPIHRGAVTAQRER